MQALRDLRRGQPNDRVTELSTALPHVPQESRHVRLETRDDALERPGLEGSPREPTHLRVEGHETAGDRVELGIDRSDEVARPSSVITIDARRHVTVSEP